MKREDIKNIMIIHSDNDFNRTWDWIGKVVLMTITNDVNICDDKVLEDSDDIEKFVYSLLPSGIEFLQYRTDKYADYCRYKDVSKEEINKLIEYFSQIKFKYNFTENDCDWISGGSETLIIDIENNKSYIH